MVTREQIEAAEAAVAAQIVSAYDSCRYGAGNTATHEYEGRLLVEKCERLKAQAAAHVEACEKALREAVGACPPTSPSVQKYLVVVTASRALIAAWAVVGKGEGDAK